MHTLVIGAGISGMMSARELLLAGVQVTLIDRRQPGRESSWAGGGIVSPLYPWRYADAVNLLASNSQKVYPALAGQLHENTGIDPEYLNSGLLILAPDETQAARQWSRQWQADLQQLDRRQMHDIETTLQSPVDTGLWLPRVAQVRNPRFMQALHSELEILGASFITDSAVTGFEHQGARITAVRTAERHYAADNILVCSGAWAADMLRDSMPQPEIEPVRGQMLLFRTEPGTVKRITLWDNHYTVPRRDGRVLFGSTLEHTGFVKETTREAAAMLRRCAVDLYPVLAKCPIEHHWAGLRPCAPGGIPYIGVHPAYHNLFINAGHYRNGVVLAPASAKLVADLILGREPEVDPAPYGFDAKRE
ncbi:MAG: glycine oxidase ThiO [Pseudomonadota bacterium]